jgi:hypothetical protein
MMNNKGEKDKQRNREIFNIQYSIFNVQCSRYKGGKETRNKKKEVRIKE